MPATKKTLIYCFICLSLILSCTPQEDLSKYPVLGEDPLMNISVLDVRSASLAAWARSGIRDARVIHVSPDDALDVMSPDDIRTIREFVKVEEWDGLENYPGSSVTEFNYLYAAARLGIVKEIYWIIPYQFFDNIPLAEEKIKEYLKEEGGGFQTDEVDFMNMKDGCLSGILSGIRINICSARTMPLIDGPVVLSIDVSYFPVYAGEYKLSKLRTLKGFVDEITFKKSLRIAHADVSYGIAGGYTRPLHRYIGDEIIEGFGNPMLLKADSPPELWMFRDRAENMFSGGEGTAVEDYLKEPLKQFPDDKPLLLLSAAAGARTGNYGNSYNTVDELCKRDTNYCHAFLYISGLISADNGVEWKGRFLERAKESVTGSRSE